MPESFSDGTCSKSFADSAKATRRQDTRLICGRSIAIIFEWQIARLEITLQKLFGERAHTGSIKAAVQAKNF